MFFFLVWLPCMFLSWIWCARRMKTFDKNHYRYYRPDDTETIFMAGVFGGLFFPIGTFAIWIMTWNPKKKPPSPLTKKFKKFMLGD